MSRTIKFRGKRIDGKGWVYGDLFNSHKEHHSPSVSIASDEFHPVGYGSKTFYEVEPTSIGQFTGLTDKNGKELFENDIIQAYRSGKKYKHDIYFIKYSDNSFVMASNDSDTKEDCIWFYEFEVIGNTTDNPELLNK